eukprot:3698189-Lingulodinium_polyedra.AAC.1
MDGGAGGRSFFQATMNHAVEMFALARRRRARGLVPRLAGRRRAHVRELLHCLQRVLDSFEAR